MAVRESTSVGESQIKCMEGIFFLFVFLEYFGKLLPVLSRPRVHERKLGVAMRQEPRCPQVARLSGEGTPLWAEPPG